MGGHAYWYFEKYNADVSAALQALRRREFEAGRYNPVIPFPDFPVGPNSPAPGAQHATIEEALEDSDADGTRSILDIQYVADEPQILAAAPLSPATLGGLYGTSQPTRRMVEQNMDLFEQVDRGQAAYVILYKDGQPNELCFVGYSFD